MVPLMSLAVVVAAVLLLLQSQLLLNADADTVRSIGPRDSLRDAAVTASARVVGLEYAPPAAGGSQFQ